MTVKSAFISLSFSLAIVSVLTRSSANDAVGGRIKTKKKGGGMGKLGQRRDGGRQWPPHEASLSRSHRLPLLCANGNQDVGFWPWLSLEAKTSSDGGGWNTCRTLQVQHIHPLALIS